MEPLLCSVLAEQDVHGRAALPNILFLPGGCWASSSGVLSDSHTRRTSGASFPLLIFVGGPAVADFSWGAWWMFELDTVDVRGLGLRHNFLAEVRGRTAVLP